ncbi:hypothetical protein [Alteribacter aurantiacus]|uniref:hypothetical protein n=1 Tax=Alteribacter aurantiacus TaxID=254410 RepID=UPI0004045E63|nr:hypothetical protein [Alteribacter aurantiacus]
MKKYKIAILIIVFLFSLPTITLGEEKDQELLIVLVPGLSFDDISWLIDHGHEETLWKTGGLGAVNVKGEGNYSYLNHAVTMGAGERASGVLGWNAFFEDEIVDGVRARDLVTQWTGTSEPAPLYHPSFPQLEKKTATSLRGAQIGRFGTRLQKAGITRHVAGNSDTRTDSQRYGSLLVIDETASVDNYTPGGITVDTSKPSGVYQDTTTIVEEMDASTEKNSVFVLEWGDLHRLYHDRSNMTDNHFASSYKETLTRLEGLIAKTLTTTNKEVWLLSPAVNDRALDKSDQLAPLWVWKKDRSQVFTWHSPTTRRDGLMASVDLVPTWLGFFGMDEGDDWIGHPVTFQTGTANPAAFLNQHKAMTAVFSKRGPVLSGYITVLVVILLAVSAVLWIKKEASLWRKVARLVLISAVSSPLLFLLTGPLIPHLSTVFYVVMLIGATGVGAILVDKVAKYPVSTICGLFFAITTWDLLNNATLIKQSFLGYDPIIGARYYGLGNEFAGVYIVSGWLMLAPFFTGGQKKRILQHATLFFVLTAMLLFLATSSLGANAGASLATGVMIGFIVYKLFLGFLNWKKLLLFIPVGGLALLGVLYVLQLNQPASHIHSAFNLLFQGDVNGIGNIILRKLEMNWKIFKISHWTQLFVTTYVLIGIYIWRGKKKAWSHERNIMIQGCIIASLALLFLNDSGIVAAATSMFVTLCASYAWLLEDGKEKN